MNIYAYSNRENKLIALYIDEPTKDPKIIADNDNRARLIAELFYNTYKSILPSTLLNTSFFRGFQKILDEEGITDSDVSFKKNCLECQYDKACPYRILTGDPQASVKDRFRRVPHSKIWTKIKQMVQSLRSYQSIDTTDQSVYRVISLAIYNKRASTYSVWGFGCDNTPVRKYKALEIETGIATLSKFISSKESSEKFKIEFPYKSEDIAYAMLNLLEWVVFIEILFSDRKKVKKLTEATFENFKLVFESIEGDKPSIEELRSLNPDQKMQLCSVCKTTELCLAKSLLEFLEEQ